MGAIQSLLLLPISANLTLISGDLPSVSDASRDYVHDEKCLSVVAPPCTATRMMNGSPDEAPRLWMKHLNCIRERDIVCGVPDGVHTGLRWDASNS